MANLLEKISRSADVLMFKWREHDRLKAQANPDYYKKQGDKLGCAMEIVWRLGAIALLGVIVYEIAIHGN